MHLTSIYPCIMSIHQLRAPHTSAGRQRSFTVQSERSPLCVQTLHLPQAPLLNSPLLPLLVSLRSRSSLPTVFPSSLSQALHEVLASPACFSEFRASPIVAALSFELCLLLHQAPTFACGFLYPLFVCSILSF